jgi:mono/diheme cytochrome c family protein
LNDEPYHWRGDKPNFAAFNGAFASLLGGSQLSESDMTAFTNFINTIVYQPNPNQNLDRTLPATIALPDVPGVSASPATGEKIFQTVPDSNGTSGQTCNTCHTSNPGIGSNLLVKLADEPKPDIVQPIKVTQLRDLYQKTHADFKAGAISIDGFGLNHDGQIGGLAAFFGMQFPPFTHNPPARYAIEAFELCFDTGMAPAVGYARTLTSASVTTAPAQSDWDTLQGQAVAGNIDLIAQGTLQGHIHGLLYQPASNNYETDTTGLGPFTQAQLTNFIKAGDTLTVMGVPPGSGERMALDRNLNGVKNGDEKAIGTDEDKIR